MVSEPSPKCLVRGGREDPVTAERNVGSAWSLARPHRDSL